MKLTKLLTIAVLLVSLCKVSAQTIDKKFVVLNTVEVGSMFLDIHYTQRCIAEGRCHEANPLVPADKAKAYGMEIGLTGASIFASYEMKKHGYKEWWLVPTIGLASHSIGIATGLRF